jgi:hypothetical protein
MGYDFLALENVGLFFGFLFGPLSLPLTWKKIFAYVFFINLMMHATCLVCSKNVPETNLHRLCEFPCAAHKARAWAATMLNMLKHPQKWKACMKSLGVHHCIFNPKNYPTNKYQQLKHWRWFGRPTSLIIEGKGWPKWSTHSALSSQRALVKRA